MELKILWGRGVVSPFPCEMGLGHPRVPSKVASTHVETALVRGDGKQGPGQEVADPLPASHSSPSSSPKPKLIIGGRGGPFSTPSSPPAGQESGISPGAPPPAPLFPERGPGEGCGPVNTVPWDI